MTQYKTITPGPHRPEKAELTNLAHLKTNLEPGELAGRVALVTGGGRGLGQVFAQALAQAGAAVAVAARSADQLQETVSLIEAQGGYATAVPLDVTDQRAVERAVETIESRFGHVDILVNNAGLWGPINPVWEVDPEQWWRTMAIHVQGSFLCARAVLPGMIARRRGQIINIVSHAGIHRWPTCSAYAVSKTAVIKFTENLAAETRRHGVAVFALHPGLATVGLTRLAMDMDAPAASPAGRAAAWIRQQVAEGQAVPPERSARLVVWLATGRADQLTGRYLTVDHNLEMLVAQADEIQQADLYTLRLRESEPAIRREPLVSAALKIAARYTRYALAALATVGFSG
jgi:NAD(P)-dependent dehydrogenase (short-subunit alcohol dehydrogenase family)